MKDISESEILQALQDAMVDPREGEVGVLPKEALAAFNEAGHHSTLSGVRQLFAKLIESGVAKAVTVKRPRWNGVLSSYSGIQFLGNGKVAD